MLQDGRVKKCINNNVKANGTPLIFRSWGSEALETAFFTFLANFFVRVDLRLSLVYIPQPKR